MTYRERKMIEKLFREAMVATIVAIIIALAAGFRFMKRIVLTLLGPVLCGTIGMWGLFSTADEAGRISGELLILVLLITIGLLVSNIQHYMFGLEWDQTLAFSNVPDSEPKE